MNKKPATIKMETIIIGPDKKEYRPGKIPMSNQRNKRWIPINAFTRPKREER